MNLDKLKIIEQGGKHDDPDGSIVDWLEFLTKPANLRSGLPDLEIAIGNWMVCFITVSFDKERSSLQSLTLRVEDFGETAIEFFKDVHATVAGTISVDETTEIPSPNHLKSWVFALFLHPGLTRIDISFMIPELPDLFDKLPNLKNVSLEKSLLVKLPPSFYRLPALESLNINGASFPELPGELKEINSLRHLSFSQPATGEALQGLVGLESIECFTEKFEVPSDISKLPNLRSLHLANVYTAPQDLLNLPKLEWLKLEITNYSKSFRFTACDAPSLRELSTNYPPAFVYVIRDFKNLRKLELNGKLYGLDAEALNVSMSYLKNLTHLTVRDSELEKMEFCGPLLSLEYLDLCENRLKSIPSNLASLPRLKEIHLRKNRLTQIDDLPLNTEFIDLSENQLNTFIDLSNLQKLRTLFLHKNNLSEFKRLPLSLEQLTLGSNRLVYISSELDYLKNLKSLSLNMNKIEEMPVLPDSLEFLDLSKNSITLIPTDFSKLKKLKKLKISGNPIEDFPELEPMPALEQLEFVGTKIPESEYTNIPIDKMMQKLTRIFPNADLCFETYI